MYKDEFVDLATVNKGGVNYYKRVHRKITTEIRGVNELLDGAEIIHPLLVALDVLLADALVHLLDGVLEVRTRHRLVQLVARQRFDLLWPQARDRAPDAHHRRVATHLQKDKEILALFYSTSHVEYCIQGSRE